MNENQQDQNRKRSPYSSFYMNPAVVEQSSSNQSQKPVQLSHQSTKNINQSVPKNPQHTIQTTSNISSGVDNQSSLNIANNTQNTNTTKYTTNFQTQETLNSNQTLKSDPHPPMSQYNPNSATSNQNNDPYLTSQTEILQNFSTDYSDKISKLKTRYANMANQNFDLIPQEHKLRLRFWYMVKTITTCGYMFWILYKFNQMTLESSSNKKSYLGKGVILFGGFILMNVAFAFHSETLYNKAFDTLFSGVSVEEVDAKLNEFKQTIVPVRF